MRRTCTRFSPSHLALLAPLAVLAAAGCDPHDLVDAVVDGVKPGDKPTDPPPPPPPDGTNPCAAVLCAPDHVCIVLRSEPPQASCVPKPVEDPCATVRCAAGTHCEAKEVQCVRAPCPPQAECVPDTKPTCDRVSCPRGTHCELKEVQCVRAPCPPQPTCVADGVKCGDNTCAAGEYCCNASCGICAPKGGACIQLACQ